MKRLWSKIKNLFRSKPKIKSHGETPVINLSKEFKPNWGFIVPHTRREPGAVSPSMGVDEYEFGMNMCNNMGFPYETRDKGGVFGAAINLKNNNINATIEPHKNAYNRKVKGFELLIMKGDKLSEYYAREIAEAFAEKFPDRKLRRDRGIYFLEKGDRGWWNLQAAKDAGIDVVILSETFFIDNDSEWISPFDMAQFWKEVLI